MVKIFIEKPSEQEIQNYEDKLNHYLQAHNAKIKIIVYDKPCIIHHTQGQEAYDLYYWTDHYSVSTPEITFELVGLFGDYGLNNKQSYYDPNVAWTDAFEIQNAIYQKLDKFKTLKIGNIDSYWKLWDLVES
jgi:hypothetical protein